MATLSLPDWIILLGSLAFIVIYGALKTRKNKNLEGFLLGDRKMKWGTIGLSIMATQASAITFLSTPGQAFDEGMGFVQFYFGLPIAMVILSATVVPIYHRLKVYTAYEFLEGRFDLKTRLLTAFLFLIQRGLAAGITIYAPAIILSTILGWNLMLTNIVVGLTVIIYTVSGGTKAVSLTQKWQMGVIMLGMFLVFGLLISFLPKNVTFGTALDIAGMFGKMEVVNFSFDISNRYTIWSGLTGGLFLAMSYFGTDQSQVQRYLGGSSVRESRMGLLFNGLLKVPMQFFILLVGIMVFVFYQFEQQPAFFNHTGMQQAIEAGAGAALGKLQDDFNIVAQEKRQVLEGWLGRDEEGRVEKYTGTKTELQRLEAKEKAVRKEIKTVIAQADPSIETNDSDYVFITFILNFLPKGLIGLLLAVILSAAMSSTAGEINALASTTIIDYYKRLWAKEASDAHYVKMSRLFTVLWGLLAIIVAILLHLADNLIELINILGSLFYGTILGIFLAGFYLRKLKANPVFWAAVCSECIVLLLFSTTDIGFLWYNVIGCTCVIGLSAIFQGAGFGNEISN